MRISKAKKAIFQQALMEKGFYPENLPPVFSVTNFYKVSRRLGLFDQNKIPPSKPTKLVRYNETKRGGQRRIFSIPNPLFFINASNFLILHMSDLSNFLKKTSFSKLEFVSTKNSERAVKIPSFSEFTALRRNVLSTSRYIVKTDISRFFPSVYTHSIPWAIHGKEAAKKDRKRDSKTVYANKIDYLVRQSQDRQTVGLPVGSDISRIIAELISVAIDKEFIAQIGEDFDIKAVRLVDDMYIGARTIDEAETFLNVYRNAVQEFELDINEAKTKIFEARNDLEPYWPVTIRRELKRFSYGTVNLKNSRSDLNAYLDEIIRLANQTNDDGILKYAIRKIDNFHLWELHWDSLEPFLMKLVVNFPHCISYVARVIAWRHRKGLNLDMKKWRDISWNTINYHSKLGNDSEIVWACWILKEINQKLPRELCEFIIRRGGSLSVLMILDLESSNLIKGRFPKRLVLNRIDNQPILSNDWLLSYEAERLFQYKISKKNRSDYSVFGNLISQNVGFFNPNAIPIVFQDNPDISAIDSALESRDDFYDDEEIQSNSLRINPFKLNDI